MRCKSVVIRKLIHEVTKKLLEKWGRDQDGWFCSTSCRTAAKDRETGTVTISLSDIVFAYFSYDNMLKDMFSNPSWDIDWPTTV